MDYDWFENFHHILEYMLCYTIRRLHQSTSVEDIILEIKLFKQTALFLIVLDRFSSGQDRINQLFESITVVLAILLLNETFHVTIIEDIWAKSIFHMEICLHCTFKRYFSWSNLLFTWLPSDRKHKSRLISEIQTMV